MRCNSKAFYRKFNQIRKQNWSAPTIMSVFIVICMGCIFSLESLGLLNKEKNLNYRIAVNPENKIILTNTENFADEPEKEKLKDKITKSISSGRNSTNNSELLGLPDASIAQKEKVNLINSILLEAAQEQFLIETSGSDGETEETNHTENEYNEVFAKFETLDENLIEDEYDIFDLEY